MRNTWKTGVAIVSIAIAAGACASAEPDISAQPAPGVMADASIAGVASTANQGEIEQGRLAATKGTNEAVREFGQKMVTDHTNAEQRLQALLERENKATATSPTATDLEQNANLTLERLQALEGAEFDRAYMDAQVSLHEWLLNTLDNTLIPAARDNDIEEHLRMMRTSVSMHLEQARSIRQTLGS